MENLAGTYTKSYISIPCTQSVYGITYIMYFQNEKNGKPNNLKVLGANQPKWNKQDIQNRFGRYNLVFKGGYCDNTPFAKSNTLVFYFQGDGYPPNMELKGLNRIAKID
jgi:hypothetical protein